MSAQPSDGDPSQASQPRAIRADAERNRNDIIEAARTLFRTHGEQVPMSVVAAAADVGVATLYRRFPDRTHLVSAVYRSELAHCAQLIDAALARPDPWPALRETVIEVCVTQAANPGFSRALSVSGSGENNQGFSTSILDSLERLIDRANSIGSLRAEFTVADVALIVLATRGIIDGADDPVAATKRLVSVALSAFDPVPNAQLAPAVALPAHWPR